MPFPAPRTASDAADAADAPSGFRRAVGRLAVVVGGRRVTMDARSVARVEADPPVGPLPLAAPPVRGITVVDGNPAALVGDEAGKVVALFCEGGLLAVRVASVEACGAQDEAPPIDLRSLAPWARVVHDPQKTDRGAIPARSGRILALRVVVGNDSVLIPAAGVQRVAPVEAARDDGENGPLVVVEGRLRRGRSLSRLRGLPPRPEPTALLVVGHDEAVTVEHVAGLVFLAEDRIQTLPGGPGGTSRRWLVETGGVVTECLPVDRILGKAAADGTGPAAVPERAAGVDRYRASGLRVACGGTDLVVPLAGVLGMIDHSRLRWHPDRVRGSASVPVVDLRRLFGGSTGCARPTRAIGFTLGGIRPVIALVDEAALDVGHAARRWRPPPPLPAAAAALVDALRSDERTGGWVMRLRLAPPSPFALRHAATALVGWADTEILSTVGPLPAAHRLATSGDA